MADQNSGIVRKQVGAEPLQNSAEKTMDEVGMEVRQLFEKGYGLLEKKQFDYAIEIFSAALDKEASFFECRMSLRAAQIRKNEKLGSIAKMAGAAANAHNMAQAKVAIARKNYLGAMSHAEKILSADPENSVGHRVIVNASQALNYPQTMISSLQILKKANPGDKDLTKELAAALEMLGDWDQAEEIMGKLAKVNPDDPVLQQAYKDTAAKATIYRGRYEATFKKDEERSKGDGGDSPSKIRTAEEALNDRINVMEERLQNEQENYKLGVDIAKVYVELKDFDRAFEYYDWVQRENQVSDSTIDKAIADAHEAKFNHDIGQFPEGSPEREGLEMERDEFLLQDCRERADRYPTMLEIRFELGERLFQVGEANEAIQAFQRAQNSPKHRLESLNYLGQCFMQRGLYDMALSQFEKALEEKGVFDEQKKELVYNLACVYEHQGRSQEALHHFKSIYEVDIQFRDVVQKVEAGYSKGT